MPRPLDRAESDQLTEIDRRLATTRSPDPTLLFRKAKVLFGARQWDKAARLYRTIAFDHADSPGGINAAVQYLECLNVLLGRMGRPECGDEMQRDVPVLMGRYCAGRVPPDHQESCEVLWNVKADFNRLRAERDVVEADKNRDVSLYRRAAQTYLDTYRNSCVGVDAKRWRYSRCDELAYNAAMAHLAADDRDSARGVLDTMRADLPSSPLTHKLACTLVVADAGACR